MRRSAVALGVVSLLALPATAIGEATPTTVVGCYDGTSLFGAEKPSSCTFVTRGHDPDVNANVLRARGLRWTGWGSSHAKSHGRTTAMGVIVRFQITLSGRYTCNDADTWYSTAKVVSAHYTSTFKLRRCH